MNREEIGAQLEEQPACIHKSLELLRHAETHYRLAKKYRKVASSNILNHYDYHSRISYMNFEHSIEISILTDTKSEEQRLQNPVNKEGGFKGRIFKEDFDKFAKRQSLGKNLIGAIERCRSKRNNLYHEPNLDFLLSEELDEARDASIEVFSISSQINNTVDVKKFLELVVESEGELSFKPDGVTQL